MSRTSLVVFHKNVAAMDATYSNASGLAFMIWNAVCHRYVNIIAPKHDIFKPLNCLQLLPEMCRLQHEGKLPLRHWERTCFLFTLDGAVSRNLLALAEAMYKFEDAHSQPGYVCHLPAAAKRLNQLAASGTRAVALYANSVGENHWIRFQEGENEDGTLWEREVHYDLDTMQEHFYIEDDLKG